MTPDEAYYYALDNGPSEETRKIACKNSEYAYKYAKFVDKEPKEDTRNAACKNPEWAFIYAYYIDKCFREDTWDAAQNTEYEEKYKKFFNSTMKEDII